MWKCQLPRYKAYYRCKWIKRAMSRFIRRQVRRDPENAWRKHYYDGYY